MSTVLVVEDSVAQREMITDFLRNSGLIVHVASDGVEALEQIQGERPDLIVLDIVMPRMNGYEVCRRLKADPNTQDVPVVMCSSKGEEFDRYWGMKQGKNASLETSFLGRHSSKERSVFRARFFLAFHLVQCRKEQRGFYRNE